ncbi:BrxE family protein [Burkholderia cepacia]|uniref:BrxE family protein n=1 Tax=Burkholderia cepacia TaxID=292 RepID=UPI001CF5DEBE|nr:BrxE family protein [Burkholderia cepacia]MCA7902615.1 BrxE family protein [Burkholderia cepacia]
MKDPYVLTLLQMRLLIGFLGERTQFAWWPTAFYEASSRLFLEPVFSKTAGLAQYHGILEAARRLHDEHLSVGSYHLFRLPEEVEQDIHTLVQDGESATLAGQILHNKDLALGALKNMTSATPTTGEGPLALGKVNELDADDVLTAIAGTYWSAFTRNVRVYPYLAG